MTAGGVGERTMDVPAPGDGGPDPFVVDIESETLANETYRTAIWTGGQLQLTVMHIGPGDDVGLEVHEDRDQFLRLEGGRARVQMGPRRDDLPFDREVEDGWAVLVPAGSWHNLTNVGDVPLKLYALYGPPEHPRGAVHPTKADAEAAEHA
jgi:mannose-6-phosphate isomerase-like protein (cupin superfamily)